MNLTANSDNIIEFAKTTVSSRKREIIFNKGVYFFK